MVVPYTPVESPGIRIISGMALVTTMDPSDDERIAVLCSTLSNPVRVSILRTLARRVLSPTEIADTLDLPVSRVSYHLERLADSGIVRCRVSGKWHNYSIDDGELMPLMALFSDLQMDVSDVERKPL